MARTKATVRRLTVVIRSDFQRTAINPLKIKKLNVKINVRKKSRYFSGRNRLIF